MRSREDGEDIVQWALIKALSAPFDGRCKPSTWMHQIVVMKCLEIQRSRYRHASMAEASPVVHVEYSIDSVIDARDRLRLVAHQIAQLPPAQKDAVVNTIRNAAVADSREKNALFKARLKLVA